jgi:catechol 2,3-dioxygenase-like lactoylglutathione lyase family enzyme
MRALFYLVVGAVSGFALHTAIAQSNTPDIVAVNHVGMNVPNLAEAADYYINVMGFPEAFRLNDAEGNLDMVYVQVSQNTFVELRPANDERPAGITHVGMHVNNLENLHATLSGRGAEITPVPLRSSPTSPIPMATAWSCWNCRPNRFTVKRWNAGSGKSPVAGERRQAWRARESAALLIDINGIFADGLIYD